MKNNFDLYNYPVKSFISYQFINIIFSILIFLLIAIFTKASFLSLFLGYACGVFAITLGFLIIVKSADNILKNASDEKSAKQYTILFLILRFIVYGVIAVFAMSVLEVNLLTLFLGYFSIKLIIYVDHIVNRKREVI